MRTRTFAFQCGTGLLALAGCLLVVNQAQAAEYWLRAAPGSVDMPDPGGGTPVAVPMWGYASCTDGTYASCGPVSVPGPALSVPAGDPTLIVHLQNGLPPIGAEPTPTSLVIHGLYKPMTPVWDDGSSGARPSATARVRSFDAEAAPGASVDYQWNNVRPGSYLYQSGTRVQVQVQMGLYGALRKNAVDPVAATATTLGTAGQVYPGGSSAFDNEATLLYSEIDPVLHAAVANGSYGNSTVGGPTSTINYAPKYFLINGQPFPFGAPVIEPVGSPGTTLLRLLNAGLTTHVPMILGRHWDLIGEDGRPYPYRRNQYTALLPAAKTLDLLLTSEIGVTYPIMDRRLSLSNAGLSNGGMMAYLRFGSLGGMAASGTAGGNTPPVAVNDSYDSVVGATLNVPATGVLVNDSDVDPGQTVYAVAASGTTTANGSYLVNANGSFTYTPAPGYAGPSDSFSYNATDGRGVSNAGTVTINMLTPPAPPTTVLDTFDRADTLNSQLGLGSGWSQVATTDAAPDVRIAGNTATAVATVLGGQAIWNGTIFGPSQYASFNAVGTLENLALLLKATGGTAVSTPSNLVRVRYEVTGPGTGAIVVATLMGGSGAEVYVKQAAFPTAVNTGTLSAAVDAKGLVTVFQNGVFVGGVQLPEVGVWKGGGRIGIQLQTVNGTIDDFGGGSL